jgi:tetratricopeptide (TPR) repeat protein
MEAVMNRELKATIFLKYGTQEDFAAAIGENPSVVSKVVRNRRKLSNVKKATQGNYAKAEPLYQRALAIFEKVLGPDHPEVALVLNNLGKLYHTQGNYAKAERFYKRSLAIMEEALGPDHLDVASCLKNFGEIYYTQGNYVNANPLKRHSLQILNKAFTPDS